MRGFITELQARDLSPFTVRGHPQVVKGFFTWLEEEGYLAQNPIRQVKMPKTPRYVVRPLEEEQVERLLRVIDPRGLCHLLVIRGCELVAKTSSIASDRRPGGAFARCRRRPDYRGRAESWSLSTSLTMIHHSGLASPGGSTALFVTCAIGASGVYHSLTSYFSYDDALGST